LFLSKYDDNNVDAVNNIIANYPDINFKVINEVFPFNTNELLAKKYFKEFKFEDILFFDTFSLYKLFVAIKDKLPVSERYITVCVNDAEVLDVIKVKYGSNLADILKNSAHVEYVGKYVYLNNFMRKTRCMNVESLIISDNIKTIFINDEDAPSPAKCIKCGKCVDVCPLGINPLAKKLDPNCIRCGLCNYVCPANINLLDKE
jgi:Na+-translocating ferredoxin:NAD+ oxidoreductase RnfC subunit